MNYAILNRMEMLAVLIAFIFGVLIGSFLNVVVLRYGFVERVRSRSECQACEKALKWYELVPVVSYIALRGKCGGCESKLSWQYPCVELLTGSVFALVFVSFMQVYTALSFIMLGTLFVFWASFIVVTVYDVRHTLIPLPFVGVLMISAFLFRGVEAWSHASTLPVQDAFFGALLFGGFLLFLYLITRGKGMGFGDVYVGIALGALFGLSESVEVITLAFWVGAVIGIILLAIKKGFKMKSEVPFVPFLFIAAAISAFTAFSPLTFLVSISTSL